MKIHRKIQQHVKPILEIKKTERQWHFPVLAGICVGFCLFVGWYFDKMQYGALSCMGALTILYFTHAPLAKRMIHLMVCAFGISFSFAFGNVMSFHPVASVFAIGFIAFLAHLVTSYFDIPPPRNFFFIMVAALAANIPFNVNEVPTHVGLVAMGAMLSVLFAFLYSVFVAKNVVELPPRRIIRKKRYTKIVESSIIGFSCALGLAIGFLLKLESPYWICIAIVAVLQGKNLTHTSHRNFQRILGTFAGVGLTWLIIGFKPNLLALVIILAVLQMVIEMLIVRNYMFATVFITPLTILLAEISHGMHTNPDTLMQMRLLDTVIGSIIGWSAGWFLHHENIVINLEKQIRGIALFIRNKLA